MTKAATPAGVPLKRTAKKFEGQIPSRLTVVGCGAVGLPLAVAFALRGFTVLGVDTDLRRIALLSERRIERVDEGLSEALNTVVAQGSIAFSSSPARCSEPCAFILAVPTLAGLSGAAISTQLELAFRTALDAAKNGDLLVVRSTVPIGTTRRLAQIAVESGRQLAIAYCPDRSISGRGFSDQVLVPNVVGGIDPASTALVAKLFAHLGSVIEVGSPEAAEAIKLFANVQRDTSFALANQFALICEDLGLDYVEICQAGSEGYSRFAPIRSGPVGGPCLPKDTFLLAQSVSTEELVRLPLAARAVNASLLDYVANAVTAHLAAKRHGPPTIAVLGLEFKGKPQTNDTRGSFGIALAERLRVEHPQSEIRTFDPALAGDADGSGLVETIRGADIVILTNNNPVLQSLDLQQTSAIMRSGGLIYDMCAVRREVAGKLPNQVTFHAFGSGFLASADSIG